MVGKRRQLISRACLRSVAELEDENGALLRENADLMDISNAVRAELNRTHLSETPVSAPPFQAADGINVVLDAHRPNAEKCLHASSVETDRSAEGRSGIRWPRRESSSLDARQKIQRQAIDGMRISMSDRETPSQRDRRRQCLQQQQQRKRELLALKSVRNYNIKDDETYRQQILKESL